MHAGGRVHAIDVVRDWCGQDPRRYAYPGAVVMVVKDGQVVVKQALGKASVYLVGSEFAASGEMRTDHVFDVASVTKVAVTTTALLMLADAGLVCLSDPLAIFFPQLRGLALGDVCLWHLLTHTGGFDGSSMLFEEAEHDLDPVSAVSKVALRWAPGTHVQYSCLGFILLGRVVERVAGERLDDFARENIFVPLRMSDTSFLPLDRPLPPRFRGRIVPSEPRSSTDRGRSLSAAFERRRLYLEEWASRHMEGDIPCGVVHDENAAWLGGVAGNAGLFSTAEDLVKLGQMYLCEGTLDGARVLSPAWVRVATRNWTAPLCCGENRGLGWQLPSRDSPFGDLAPEACFGHTGFTGTGLWIDAEHRMVAVLLTNRLQFTRSNELILRVRRLFLNSLFAAFK